MLMQHHLLSEFIYKEWKLFDMETRREIAAEKKWSGKYNCAQAVACTYADVVGVDESLISAVTSSFGTGMGTMEGTCGALVGAGVIAGLKIRDRVKSRAVMKSIMSRFKEKNQSTVCRDLKGAVTGCPLRDCNGCVADAAAILEEELGITD